MSIIIGFTGTNRGLTNFQRNEIYRLLVELKATEFHHGDCVGADLIAHKIALSLHISIVVHPPENTEFRAYSSYIIAPLDLVTTLDTDDYILRNHAIVDAADIMLATPKGNEPEIRSGTWATIRYARRFGNSIYIIFPKRTELERWGKERK